MGEGELDGMSELTKIDPVIRAILTYQIMI